MKLKFTRSFVLCLYVLLGVALTFLTFWLFSETKIFNDVIVKDAFSRTEVSYGWIHCSINFIFVILDFTWIVLLIGELANDRNDKPLRWFYGKYNRHKDYSSDDEDEKPIKPIRWKRWVFFTILFIFLIQVIRLGKTIYSQSVFLYNTNKKYTNTYQQKVEEKQGFYDKLWKTYLQKEKITGINKDVFVQVTKIIMENRKDGEKVTWKWLQENQQIPYDEFTKFYADLSNFIETQREAYFSIEKTCQLIANENNTMIDTFPNNIYNHFLKIPKINFQYGFLSDSTSNVFSTRKENLK